MDDRTVSIYYYFDDDVSLLLVSELTWHAMRNAMVCVYISYFQILVSHFKTML
jgi:hypothetical protein